MESLYLLPKRENIKRQILFIKVISMFCRNHDGEGMYRYQMQAINFLFSSDQNIPIKFGVDERNSNRPFIHFVRKAGETYEMFLTNNPLLDDLNKAPPVNVYSADIPDMIFYLDDLTTKADVVMPYIEYIAAVLELYTHTLSITLPYRTGEAAQGGLKVRACL